MSIEYWLDLVFSFPYWVLSLGHYVVGHDIVVPPMLLLNPFFQFEMFLLIFFLFLQILFTCEVLDYESLILELNTDKKKKKNTWNNCAHNTTICARPNHHLDHAITQYCCYGQYC